MKRPQKLKAYTKVLILLLLHGAFFALSQDYTLNFQKFGVEDGLSHRKVNCILQDREGMLWVGTSQGLNRFDGHTFKYWTKADNGLPFDNVASIYEDSDGMLWLFSSGIKWEAQVFIFDPATGQFFTFEKYFEGKYHLNAESFTLGCLKDETGAVYWGTQNPAGYIKYHPKTGFQHVVISQAGFFYPSLVTGNHTVWGRYTEKNTINLDSLVTLEIDSGGKPIGSIGRSNIKGDPYSQDGSFYYEDVNRQTYRYVPSKKGAAPERVDAPVAARFQSRPLWAFLDGGKVLAAGTIVKEVATGKHIAELISFMPELVKVGITAWTIDHDGCLWVGYDFGLVRLDVKKKMFKSLMFNGDNTKLGTPVRGILPKRDGWLLVNTEFEGQWILDEARNVVVNKIDPDTKFYYGVGEDADGNAYCMTIPIGLVQLESNGATKTYPGLLADQAWHFYNDGQKLWICTQVSGVRIFDPKANTMTEFGPLNQFQDFFKTIIYHIGKDNKGRLWACGGNGFYQIDPEKGVLARYWTGGEGQYHFPVDYIVHFYCDDQGVFWLATVGGGLIRWDKDGTGEVRQFGRKSGFPSQTIYAVYQDDHDHLWMPSDYGVIQFDKAQQQVRRIFGLADGITHQEYNRIAHARDRNGTLYFGGLNGITVFDPNHFYNQSATKDAPLVISECLKYNTRLGKMDTITNDVKKTGSITLRAGESYCSIDLALLTFDAPAQIQYAYRFGNDEKWTIVPGRTLYLGGLPFGEQQLHIKAQAANGVWSDKQLTLSIYQMRPYYLQAWFILTMATLIIGGFFGFFRWRTHELESRQKLLESEISNATAHIEHQAAELRKLDEVKSRFFANVSHELRTPLTLMLGPIGSAIKSEELNKRNRTLLGLAQEHGRSLLRLVNQILDLSKLESNKLELQESAVRLDALLDRIVAAFDSHAERLQVRFSFENKMELNQVLVLDVLKVETIINNLLSNAMKFTPAGGEVKVLVEESAGKILLSVKDTGRGVHPSDLPLIFERFFQTKQTGVTVEGGTGIGLALCKELVELMKGRIWAESVLGKGSTFFVEIPKVVASESALPEKDGPPLGSNAAAQEQGHDLAGDDAEALSALKNAAASLERKGQQFSVLVVEDNLSLRDYLKIVLESKFNVTAVENGQVALDYLNGLEKEQLPDLILSDVMMPVMDGLQLMKHLKGDDRYRHLPMVMLTARADIEDKLHALRIGVDDYLIKPFEEEELLTRLDNLLLNYQMRRAASIEYRGYKEEDLAESAPSEEGPDKEMSMRAEDQEWLLELEAMVKKKLGDPNLTADILADYMAMSRSTLYRQVKRMTGLTPIQYIEEARFQFARQKFESGESRSVKATAYQSGFLHVGNFSRLYHKRFGKYPSEY